MLKIFLLLTFMTTCLLMPQASQAELSPAQSQFVKNFLGLGRAAGKEKFEIIENAKLDPKLSGRVLKESPRTIEVNGQTAMQIDGTIVHEAIHLHFYDQRPDEEMWAMEGIAQLGEFLYLYQQYGKEAAYRSFFPIVSAYRKDTHRALMTFDQSPADYGKTFLFFLFAYEAYQKGDYASAYFHQLQNGLEGLIEAAHKSNSAKVAPANWKDSAVLTREFQRSINEQQNTLATSINDSFTLFLKL